MHEITKGILWDLTLEICRCTGWTFFRSTRDVSSRHFFALLVPQAMLCAAVYWEFPNSTSTEEYRKFGVYFSQVSLLSVHAAGPAGGSFSQGPLGLRLEPLQPQRSLQVIHVCRSSRSNSGWTLSPASCFLNKSTDSNELCSRIKQPQMGQKQRIISAVRLFRPKFLS